MTKYKVGDRVRLNQQEIERGTVTNVSDEDWVYVEWDDVEWYDSVRGWVHPAKLLSESVDAVNPSHYKRFPVEVIVITEHLNFCKGNAVKYLTRSGHKEGSDELEDLRKAEWYVRREIARVEAERSKST